MLVQSRHQITQDGIAILKEIKELLDEYKIEFWLDAGTLLGAMREGGFIEGDYDIDICVWRRDFKRAKKAFNYLPYHNYMDEKRLNFRLFNKGVRVGVDFVEFDCNGIYKDSYLYPVGIVGQFFDSLIWILNSYPIEYKETKIPASLHSVIARISENLPFKESLKKIVKALYEKLDSYYIIHLIPEELYIPFKKKELYGMEFNIPKNAEEYLKYRYGNWRVKNPKYIYCNFTEAEDRICEDGTIIWKERRPPTPSELKDKCKKYEVRLCIK